MGKELFSPTVLVLKSTIFHSCCVSVSRLKIQHHKDSFLQFSLWQASDRKLCILLTIRKTMQSVWGQLSIYFASVISWMQKRDSVSMEGLESIAINSKWKFCGERKRSFFNHWACLLRKKSWHLCDVCMCTITFYCNIHMSNRLLYSSSLWRLSWWK